MVLHNDEQPIETLKPKNIMNINISNNLRKLMTLACISEHELSRRTNIKQPIINRILSGKNTNPKLLTLKPIADYFMVTVSQLIGEQQITSTWNGLTSSKHAGWTDIPLFNWEKANKVSGLNLNKIITTESITNQNTFALYITDESMEPLIPKGSVSIIDPETLPSDDDYIAVEKDDNIFVRNLLVKSGIKYINCVNSQFGTIKQLSTSEKILGVVIRVIYNYAQSLGKD